MNPAVSVIIPVRDGERTLARSIESVLSQGDDLEVIVVDDGSTDGSADIAASLGARVVTHEESAGVAAARNRGIAESRGELLAFNDADDEWRPGKLASQRALLDRHPELQFVLCAFQNVADEGYPLAAWATRPPSRGGDEALAGYIFQAMLARRSAFLQVGLLDPEMRWSEDTDWFLRALDLEVPHLRTDEVFVTRYVHDKNLTGDVAMSQRYLVRAVRASMQRRRFAGRA